MVLSFTKARKLESGAASATIVAAAFSKYLAPVGVLMAVLGYAVGTYGAYVCGLILQATSGFLS